MADKKCDMCVVLALLRQLNTMQEVRKINVSKDLPGAKTLHASL